MLMSYTDEHRLFFLLDIGREVMNTGLNFELKHICTILSLVDSMVSHTKCSVATTCNVRT